jgi:hypothetical protein
MPDDRSVADLYGVDSAILVLWVLPATKCGYCFALILFHNSRLFRFASGFM